MKTTKARKPRTPRPAARSRRKPRATATAMTKTKSKTKTRAARRAPRPRLSPAAKSSRRKKRTDDQTAGYMRAIKQIGAPAPIPADGQPKLATMPKRDPTVKADINVRFSTSDQYAAVKRAALHTTPPMSMNKFIVEAALEAARALVAAQPEVGRRLEPAG